MTEELSRFVDAQRDTYAAAISELRAGRKQGHWIWFVFPQLRGLGSSENASYFGITGLVEARAYLADPVLGERLIACTDAVLAHADRPIRSILGYPDDLKFISSMTLFSVVPDAPGVFQRALDVFNSSNLDAATLRMIRQQEGAGDVYAP